MTVPQTPPPQSWIDDAVGLLIAGKPIKCWRCAVLVDADKIAMPGRCTAPGRVPDPCPLNAVPALAKKEAA